MLGNPHIKYEELAVLANTTLCVGTVMGSRRSRNGWQQELGEIKSPGIVQVKRGSVPIQFQKHIQLYYSRLRLILSFKQNIVQRILGCKCLSLRFPGIFHCIHELLENPS